MLWNQCINWEHYLLFLRIYMTWNRQESITLCITRSLGAFKFCHPTQLATYHSCSYSSNSDKKKWHQHIADCHISIYDGRRLSSTVHCIYSGNGEGGGTGGCLCTAFTSSKPPLYGRHCAADLSSNYPLVVYASSLSFMWLAHGINALSNQQEICGNTGWKKWTVEGKCVVTHW